MDQPSRTSSRTLPPGSSSDSDDAAAERQYAPVAATATPNSPSRNRRRSSVTSVLHPVATKEQMDPELDVNLPYRTLSPNANLDEYRVETRTGEIPATATSATGPDAPAGNYKLVTFVPNDPENPKNWSKAYKWYCTMVVAMTCFVVAFCSSVITADIAGVAEEFNVSEEAALVSISVFVIGFGVGPMAFAPLSEIYGRQVIYASTLLLAVVFIIPCAVANNFATLIVCRTIDGIAFSAPMTLVGGTLADLWRNEERGVPMAAFSAAPFIGPAIGPLVGGFLSDAAGWRWLYWIQLILAFVVWVLISFTVPETYAPTILARRARKMRKDTGDASHVTEQDIDMRPLSERLGIFLIRPFQLLFRELIVFLISIYMSVLYGLLYMFFVAFPIIYQKRKGYSASSTGLMFIPLAVGVLCSAACSPWVNKHYLKLVAKHNGHPPAESRLIPMMLSCWFIPIGLFIFAWTSYPRLHWAGPPSAHQAASALAAKTCIRSFWGAGVVLFTEQMYDRLGDQWASSLLGFLGLACCAIPFLFWVYGARIRARSKYAYSADDETSGSDIEKAKPQKNVLAPTRTFEPA
ncbi:major facilitator superfamily transporter [Colletotrichum tofieldiae]|nr:major facilitator superfamily transporter [Colletotrichum tofieldiae]